MGKKKTEGYSILPPIDRDRYQTRKGLEGPFQTKSGKTVYYDPKEGAYYDPDTDMYLTYDEWKALDEANRPPQDQPPRTTTPPAKPKPQYTDAIARAAQQAGQYDDTYVPPTPEPDLPPPGDPAIKPNVDDILRDLDRQYGTGDEFMTRDPDDIGNPRPPRDPSSFGPGGQPIPDPTPEPSPYQQDMPDPMDDLLGPDDGDIEPENPKPAPENPSPRGDDGATDMEGEGKPGPNDFEQERFLDDKGTTSNVGVKASRGKRDFAIATVGGKETKVYGSREALKAKYPDAPIYGADGTKNESIKMDARTRANSIFEKAMNEFEFNPNAGHRDQPSHPENRGLTNPRSTSPRPQLRPGSTRSTSPRPKMRPKDLEMKSAIDAALRQAMGEGKLTEEEYNWWDKFLGKDKAKNNPFRNTSGDPLSLGARSWPEPGEYEDPEGFRAGKYADYNMDDLPPTKTIHGRPMSMPTMDPDEFDAIDNPNYTKQLDPYQPAEPWMSHGGPTGKKRRSSNEGASPHKKGSAKYKAHMAAKHASMNEWGGDDQYQAVEGFIENALSMFDEMLDNGVDELRARAEAHDYLKGELGDLGVTHGDMESKQYHSELEKEIVQIMNLRDKGMEENNLPASTAGFRSGIRFRSGGRASGPVSQSTHDREMAAFNQSKTAPKPKAPKMINGPRTEHAGMNEGKYGKKKKKKSKKYEQVDINKLKESINMKNATDNQAIASYVRTMLDESYDSWAKIHNQVHFVIDLLAEGHNVNAKQVLDILSKTNIQEQLDRKMKVNENVSMMRKIVADKSALPVKFKDSTMKVDMTTANIFLQVFDQQKPETQEKIMDKIETKNGFLKILDIIYDRLK
jgi:hypothetical protein